MHEQTRRQQTSPLVKWLLNERAALTGRMAQLDEKLDVLQPRLVQAERFVKDLATRVSVNRRAWQEAAAAHKALDTVSWVWFDWPLALEGAGVPERAAGLRCAGGVLMALTMTRTRTQTALTDLSKMVANVHGELEFIDWALQHRKKGRAVLLARRQQVLVERDALYTTLRTFKPDLDPEAEIGRLNEWLKPFGRRWTGRAAGRYIRAHST